MDYIHTRSPITQAEIDEIIESLAKVNTAAIDGGVLSNIVRTCHECGLKKSELIDLSVGDVSRGGKINDSMQVGDSTISLTERAKKVLQEHIDYLGIKGYKRYSSSPLFSTKNHRRYSSRNLDNHLKTVLSANFKLEKIRQAGICNRYDELKNQGLSARDCFEATKAFARISTGQLKGILTGNIQRTGKKMPIGPGIKHLKEIDEIMGSPRPDIEKLQKVKTAVIKDPAVYDELKEALIKSIDSNISSAQKANNDGRKRPENLEVTEKTLMEQIFEIYERSENQSEDYNDAAEQIRAYFFGDEDK